MPPPPPWPSSTAVAAGPDLAHAVGEVEQDRGQTVARGWPSAPRQPPSASRPRARRSRCCRRGTAAGHQHVGARAGPTPRPELGQRLVDRAARLATTLRGRTATYIGPASRSVMRVRSASASLSRERRARRRDGRRPVSLLQRLRGGVDRAALGSAAGAASASRATEKSQGEQAHDRATRRRGSARAPGAAAARRRAARPAAPRASSSSRSSSAIRLESAFSASAIGSGRWTQSASGPSGLRPSTRTGVARVADHGRVRRHVVDDDRVGADLRAVADPDRPEQLRPRADRHVVLDRRVALAGREAGAAERHALVERHVLADLGGLADHDAHAVVDEQPVADVGGRVDLDPGHGPRASRRSRAGRPGRPPR